MKKAIVLSLFILAIGSIKAFAQTEAEATKPVKVGNEWQMPKDVLLRTKSYADKLKRTLGLDEPTTKKVFDAYLGNTKAVDEIRMGQASEKERKDQLAANQEEFDKTLQGILTPAQFAAYLKGKKK